MSPYDPPGLNEVTDGKTQTQGTGFFHTNLTKMTGKRGRRLKNMHELTLMQTKVGEIVSARESLHFF